MGFAKSQEPRAAFILPFLRPYVNEKTGAFHIETCVIQPTVLLGNSWTAAALGCARARRADPPRRADKAAPRKIAALQTVILNERHSRE